MMLCILEFRSAPGVHLFLSTRFHPPNIKSTGADGGDDVEFDSFQLHSGSYLTIQADVSVPELQVLHRFTSSVMFGLKSDGLKKYQDIAADQRMTHAQT